MQTQLLFFSFVLALFLVSTNSCVKCLPLQWIDAPLWLKRELHCLCLDTDDSCRWRLGCSSIPTSACTLVCQQLEESFSQWHLLGIQRTDPILGLKGQGHFYTSHSCENDWLEKEFDFRQIALHFHRDFVILVFILCKIFLEYETQPDTRGKLPVVRLHLKGWPFWKKKKTWTHRQQPAPVKEALYTLSSETGSQQPRNEANM